MEKRTNELICVSIHLIQLLLIHFSREGTFDLPFSGVHFSADFSIVDGNWAIVDDCSKRPQ